MAALMPTKEMTVAEVLDEWPDTVPVFHEFKTACVGCVMAPFDSLVDVAQIYKLDLEQMLLTLRKAIDAGDGQGG